MNVMQDTVPDHCVLLNAVFTRLGNPTFRRAESDGAAVMVIPLGDGTAALPLRSLQREFGIEDASPDGRMLGLISDSLDFVSGLQLGDPLPSEVLTGKASWHPAAKHQQMAAAKLRLQLLAWIDPNAAAGYIGQPPSLEQMESDPALRGAIQRAFERAAAELDLGGPQEVIALVSDIAQELSYIEALRETFLRRVQSMVSRVEGLSTGAIMNVDRAAALGRIRKLSRTALDLIKGRFVEIDAQTGEVLATLRNVDSFRTFIRAHRDWLYRSSRAWEQILLEWDSAMPGMDESTWARLNRTYQFLAPRFMPVQEWFSASQAQSRRAKKPTGVMVW